MNNVVGFLVLAVALFLAWKKFSVHKSREALEPEYDYIVGKELNYFILFLNHSKNKRKAVAV